MHMQVKYRLSRLRPHIEHRPIAILNAALACYVGGSEMTTADQFGVLGRGFF